MIKFLTPMAACAKIRLALLAGFLIVGAVYKRCKFSRVIRYLQRQSGRIC